MNGPRLIVTDAFRERETFALVEGATLAIELMRLFPEKIEGPWKLYAHCVDEGCEVNAADMPTWKVESGDTYYLVRLPGTGVEFWVNFAITLLLTAASRLFMPKPRRVPLSQSETRESGTNQLAAQTNVLRPGARVPDILGRLRVYPDLLTYPAEQWTWPNAQRIVQWFTIGVGEYEVANLKLGETPMEAIEGTSSERFPPGTPVAITAIKSAPTVDNLSLDSVVSGGDVPASNIQFIAATKTLRSPERISLVLGAPINIRGTLYNGDAPPGKDFFVVGLPPADQIAGPYDYTLDGPVADEPNAQPAIKLYQPYTGDLFGYTYTDGNGQYLTTYSQVSFGSYDPNNPSPGDFGDDLYMLQVTRGGVIYRGRLRAAWYRYDEPTTNVLNTDLDVPFTLYGVAMALTWTYEQTPFQIWYVPPDSLVSLAAPLAAGDPIWTGWHTAPLADADELWLDIAFPQGLVRYDNSTARNYSVTVQAEFRRLGTTAPVVAITLNPFTAMRQTYLRHTSIFKVAELGLPGSGAIEVRMRRVTPIPANTATDQYVSDSRWASFRAVRQMPAAAYPDVTLLKLGLLNTRSASSIGENSFNAVVTRVLPTWDGLAWSVPGPTDKWADNFVARCKSADGAALSDTLIDIAGIYTLQWQLDTMDGGAQGKIALALDQVQDIDTELAQVADVVRAQTYRVGRKLFVVRDQSTSERIALFNGRAKSADGEGVALRMASADENDGVAVQWIDEGSGWNLREYVYSDYSNPVNLLQVGVVCANWAQVYRRALFEWYKIKYRREQITCAVTEDGRICRPGDVVNITDDVANLALAAGEVIYVDGLVLTLDHDFLDVGGTAFTIVLRDTKGQLVDTIPCTKVAGSSNKVQLSRAPVITIKPRDEALGTLYAFYGDLRAIVRQWLLTAVEASGPYVQISGVNYTELVYNGDTSFLPPVPPLQSALVLTPPRIGVRP